MARRIITAGISAVLWTAVIAMLWSGATNMIAAAHDSIAVQAVSTADTQVAAQAVLKWKAALKRAATLRAQLAPAQPSCPRPDLAQADWDAANHALRGVVAERLTLGAQIDQIDQGSRSEASKQSLEAHYDLALLQEAQLINRLVELKHCPRFSVCGYTLDGTQVLCLAQ